MKVILDTNVIIAAFATHGLCSAIFELCLDRFDVVLSEEILKETSTHLQGKIKLPAGRCEAIISYLRTHCMISAAVDTADASACRDQDDLHLLGLASETDAEYLITGDKDLLELKQYKNTKIITPRQLWASIEKSQK